MSPVQRDSTAGRAYLDLQKMARRRGRPTQEMLLTYVLERFLFRLSRSAYRDQLVLKGGMLLAVLGREYISSARQWRSEQSSICRVTTAYSPLRTSFPRDPSGT
jgi:hypothetical protein